MMDGDLTASDFLKHVGLDVQNSPPPDNTGKYIAAAICITLIIIGICAN
jgi:hypothetical protein